MNALFVTNVDVIAPLMIAAEPTSAVGRAVAGPPLAPGERTERAFEIDVFGFFVRKAESRPKADLSVRGAGEALRDFATFGVDVDIVVAPMVTAERDDTGDRIAIMSILGAAPSVPTFSGR